MSPFMSSGNLPGRGQTSCKYILENELKKKLKGIKCYSKDSLGLLTA